MPWGSTWGLLKVTSTCLPCRIFPGLLLRVLHPGTLWSPVPGQLGSPVRRFPSSCLCVPDQYSPQRLAGHHPSPSMCCVVLWAGFWLPQSLAPNAQVYWQFSLDLSTFSDRLWVPGGQELCLVLSQSVLSPSAALTAQSRDAAGGCEWLQVREGGQLTEHWATCLGRVREAVARKQLQGLSPPPRSTHKPRSPGPAPQGFSTHAIAQA